MINNDLSNRAILDSQETRTSGGGDRPDPPNKVNSFDKQLEEAVTTQTSGGGDRPDPPK